MPALLRSPDARVVSVTSTGRHFGPPVDPDDPHMRRRYSPWRAYGQAKLANVHFALELQRRFEEAGVSARSIVVHPGFTNTDLQARSARESGGLSQRFFRGVVRRTGMTPARGALSLLRAATDPDARGGNLLHAAVRQQRAAGPAPALAEVAEPRIAPDVVGGVRTRDGRDLRGEATGYGRAAP